MGIQITGVRDANLRFVFRVGFHEEVTFEQRPKDKMAKQEKYQ